MESFTIWANPYQFKLLNSRQIRTPWKGATSNKNRSVSRYDKICLGLSECCLSLQKKWHKRSPILFPLLIGFDKRSYMCQFPCLAGVDPGFWSQSRFWLRRVIDICFCSGKKRNFAKNCTSLKQNFGFGVGEGELGLKSPQASTTNFWTLLTVNRILWWKMNWLTGWERELNWIWLAAEVLNVSVSLRHRLWNPDSIRSC